MATVTGLTAARMAVIEGASVISGTVVGNNLILTKFNGSTVDAGNVRGATGPTATQSGTYAARPAATAGLNGIIYFATDKMMMWECIAAAWVLIAVFAPEVSSLPASPIDQQECIYVADATAGVKWHLRYRSASASAYKWEPVNNAAPLTAENLAVNTTTSTTYVDGSSPGPSIVVPLAGDYLISFGADLYNGTAGGTSCLSPKLGAAATSDNEMAIVTSPNVNNQCSVWRSIRRTALAASDTIKLQLRCGTGTANAINRNLEVRPMRVG